MKTIQVNIQTGEVVEIPLTPEEVAEINQRVTVAPVAVCSPWQIRKALNAANLRQPVEDAIAASSDVAVKDGWEFATEFRSDDLFVLSMGAAIGKNAEETRQFIEYAATL